MRSIIEVRKLTFGYDELLFSKLSFKIKERSFTTIFGINGCGKTTLAKLLVGLINNNQTVLCDNFYVTSSNLMRVRRDIGLISDEFVNNYIVEKVSDEIAFSLENLNFSKDEINKKVNSMAYKLKIRGLLSRKMTDLDYAEKWLVSLASNLVYEPKVLIIDGGFEHLSSSKKEKVLEVLKNYRENGMTIVNLTSNIEECLYGDEIIVIDEGKALGFGSKEDFFDDLEFFDKNNIDFPFIVSLSNKLKLYNLISDVHFDMEELVNVLWK